MQWARGTSHCAHDQFAESVVITTLRGARRRARSRGGQRRNQREVTLDRVRHLVTHPRVVRARATAR